MEAAPPPAWSRQHRTGVSRAAAKPPEVMLNPRVLVSRRRGDNVRGALAIVACPGTNPLCVKRFPRRAFRRVRSAPWREGVVGRSVLSGPGSDLTEEPASRDVEPVTLAEESFPFVLPGPSTPGALRVGDELAVDGVAHVSFEHA
jgi:hypothetical protein